MMGVARVRAGLRGVAKKWIGPFVADRQPRRVDLPPATWGLAVGPNGSLWSGPVDLAALAGSHGSPVHVVLTDMLDRNARDALSGAAEHRFDVFYSFKTNPVPAVLRRLYDHGIGAEVISPFELWMARRLGVAPERIVYNGPAKSDESLIEAISNGVHLVNANSASEARRIGDLADELRRPVNLGLRVALPGSWAGQFGLAVSSATLVDTVRDAANRRFVNLRGLHAHRGKTLLTHGDVTAHVCELLAVCDQLRKEAGWHPEILDVGGSLACPTSRPIPTRQFRLNRGFGSDLLPPNPATAISISDAAALARRLVDDHFAPSGLESPRLIIEPGRALTGNTQLLLVSVVDVKTDGPLAHAILDAGINVAEPVPNEYHQLFHVQRPNAAPERCYRLAGPICTPADVLYNNWSLPELRVGDVLAVMDSGAYFVPFSTAFSFGRAAIVMQDGEAIEICRRPESFEDIIALDDPSTFATDTA
jgi:diaminopimelate decarboxylase